MERIRIIKRTNPDGGAKYVIQQKYFLFRWMWVDAWINSWAGAYCIDSFDSFNEAEKNICYFDGSKSKEKILWQGVNQ